MNSTTRLGLQKPQTSDAATGLRTATGTNADKLDDVGLFTQGTLASRPTSTPGSPGLRDRFYFATDTRQLFRDSGTGWDEVAMLEAIATRLGLSSGGVVRRGYAEVLASETGAKSSPGPFDTDPGTGPVVTIAVPANGLVAVFAQADSSTANTYVGLQEDATTTRQIFQFASAPATFYTVPGSTAGASSKFTAGALIFPATAGPHTYRLRVGHATQPLQWSNRKLWVWTLGM